jgi:heterodisulfide reductase subunit A-like polyferredoxin
MLTSSGYVAALDAALCQGCKACAAQCPFRAIGMEAGVPQVDVQACMGCGVCVAHCPAGALSLVRAPEKGEPLEIQTLMGS